MTKDAFDIQEGTAGYLSVFSLIRRPMCALKSQITRFVLLVDRKKSFSCNLGKALTTE